MNKKLEEYLPIIKFLVKFLGKDTEVVMHDFTDGLDNSLVFIANNHSGRELGAPATNFVLEVFKSKIYLEKDFLVNYSFKSVNGKELHSSTFFIKEENNLIGMICLNVDRSKRNMLEKLSMNILEILNEEDEAGDELDNIKENFYVNSEHLIEETILQETNGKDIEK